MKIDFYLNKEQNSRVLEFVDHYIRMLWSKYEYAVDYPSDMEYHDILTIQRNHFLGKEHSSLQKKTIILIVPVEEVETSSKQGTEHSLSCI